MSFQKPIFNRRAVNLLRIAHVYASDNKTTTDLSPRVADLQALRESGMASLLFSVFLLLQTPAPAAGVRISGKANREQIPVGQTQVRRSGTPLSALFALEGGAANVSWEVRPDGTFSLVLPEGQRRINVTAAMIPSGYAVTSDVRRFARSPDHLDWM